VKPDEMGLLFLWGQGGSGLSYIGYYYLVLSSSGKIIGNSRKLENPLIGGETVGA